MRRNKSRKGLYPWIESLIQSFGSEEGSGNNGRLKAYATSVGEMNQSLAQNVEGPKTFLFLSDGTVQIPASLSSSTWERLQEEAEMDSFTSLVHSTVSFRKYQLRFHMALDVNDCSFYLAVGDLLILSVGPEPMIIRSYLDLYSVQQKIGATWRMLLERTPECQNDHAVFDLSELLGEWQHEILKTVLADVRTQLMAKSAGLRCNMSTGLPILVQPAEFAPTGWDIERGQDHERECFSIPIKCFLISEGRASQERRPNVESLGMDGGAHSHLSTSESPKKCKIQNCGNIFAHQDDTRVDLRKANTIQEQMSNAKSLRMDEGKQLNLSASESPQYRKIENCGNNFKHQGDTAVDLRKQDTIQKQKSNAESLRKVEREQLNLSTSESSQKRKNENYGNNFTHKGNGAVDLRKQDTVQEQMSNAARFLMDGGKQLNLSTSDSPQNRKIENCGNIFMHQSDTHVDLRKQDTIQEEMSNAASFIMDGGKQLNLSTLESPQNRKIENCGSNVTHQGNAAVDLRKQDDIQEQMSNAESLRMDEGEQLNMSTSESPQNMEIENCGNNVTHQGNTAVDLTKQDNIQEQMSNMESLRMDEGEQLNMSTSESPQNMDIENCRNNFTHQDPPNKV
ncbi:adrenocortical dysplasia protein homolog isoform X2 [Stigmatopora nigra]